MPPPTYILNGSFHAKSTNLAKPSRLTPSDFLYFLLLCALVSQTKVCKILLPYSKDFYEILSLEYPDPPLLQRYPRAKVAPSSFNISTTVQDRDLKCGMQRLWELSCDIHLSDVCHLSHVTNAEGPNMVLSLLNARLSMAPGGTWNMIDRIFLFVAKVYPPVNHTEPLNLYYGHSCPLRDPPKWGKNKNVTYFKV